MPCKSRRFAGLPSGAGLELDDGVRSMVENAAAQTSSAKAMIGIETRSIRRRPMRSMRTNARRVKRKFVTATESEVRVGEEKDNIEKMVALKYMTLLNPESC
jgi:hypothetical protein